jgi:hypothetical protein
MRRVEYQFASKRGNDSRVGGSVAAWLSAVVWRSAVVNTVAGLLGAASATTAGILAVAYVVVTGLRSMSQRDLLSRDRQLIGVYMLIGILAVLAASIALAAT